MESNDKGNKDRKEKWAIALVLAFVGVCALVALVPSNLRDTLSLVPKDERFTEVYFDDHESLPRVIRPGEQDTFAFTIANHEGRELEYGFDVYFVLEDPIVGPDAKYPIWSHSVKVADGEKVRIPVTYAFKSSRIVSGRIVVSLIARNESIEFKVHI